MFSLIYSAFDFWVPAFCLGALVLATVRERRTRARTAALRVILRPGGSAPTLDCYVRVQVAYADHHLENAIAMFDRDLDADEYAEACIHLSAAQGALQNARAAAASRPVSADTVGLALPTFAHFASSLPPNTSLAPPTQEEYAMLAEVLVAPDARSLVEAADAAVARVLRSGGCVTLWSTAGMGGLARVAAKVVQPLETGRQAQAPGAVQALAMLREGVFAPPDASEGA